MAASLKQIEAAQRFLRGIVSLGSFSEIREKQCRGVCHALGKLSMLTAAQAAEWLAALDNELWTAAQVAEFQEAVAAKTKALEEDSIRVILQDFLMLPYYLTEELATMVFVDEEVDRDVVLQKLCSHAARLTLKNASEASKAMLLVLANWRLVEKMSPQNQYQFYVSKKPLVTKYLAAAAFGGQGLPELPMSWQDLPKDLRQKLFPTGKPAVLTEPSAAAIVQFVRTYPLRKDNKMLLPQAAAQSAQAAHSTDVVSVDAVVKVVEACSRLRPETLRETVGASTRSTGSACEMKRPMLALEDGTVDGSSDPRGQAAAHVETVEKQPLTVAQQLAALKTRLPEEMNPTEKATPSGRKGAKAIAKRPAASLVAKRPATCRRGLKRPAAAAPLGREAKRQQLLRKIPEDLKRKYKNGCSKCRYTFCTPSCWAGRGFTL
jgi:hypothetical protein